MSLEAEIMTLFVKPCSRIMMKRMMPNVDFTDDKALQLWMDFIPKEIERAIEHMTKLADGEVFLDRVEIYLAAVESCIYLPLS